MPRHSIIAEDCRIAFERTLPLWQDVAGRRIFVTGGTGFFGTWFLELLTTAMDAMAATCEVVILTRNPDDFASGPAAHIAQHRCVRLLRGDVQTFAYPAGGFDYVAHFGSTGAKAWHDAEPRAFYEFVVDGTRRVLDFAVASGAIRFLLASTGAVYGGPGGTPARLIDEQYRGSPDPSLPLSANAEAKRAAEFLSVATAHAHPRMRVALARGFAFVGPYLPAHAGFAAFDFLQTAISGRALTIHGDGTPVRSYMYGSDLAVWLWTLLLRAEGNGAWNVGSEVPVTITELARRIAALSPTTLPVHVAQSAIPDKQASWYVPSTTKAHVQLNLQETVPLGTALERTLRWYQETSTPQLCVV